MSLNNEQIAEKIIHLCGGVENIKNNSTCMTRLHIRYYDHEFINIKAIQQLDSVFGVVDGDTIQIIFGPGKVTNIGNSISEITRIPLALESEVEEVEESLPSKTLKFQPSRLSHVQAFFKHFANIFLPVLPGIAGAGLINGVTRAINTYTNNAYVGIWWYALIMTMGWALFMYLPIFVGMNAAKEFKGTPILGGIGGALSVTHIDMPLLDIINGKEILLPITHAPYNYAVGGILAAVITGIAFAYIERAVRKFVPQIIDMFVTPLLTIIIGGFLSVLVFQYLGSVLTDFIYISTEFIFNQLGIFGGFILSAIQLPLVSLGLHRVFIPLHAILSDPAGKTAGINYLLPILMVAGGGQVGAALALYVRTSNTRLKKSIIATIPAGILGIGEPLMYAVTMPLLRPFITACIGSGFGGMMIVLLKVGAISQGVSGIMAPLIMASGSRLPFIIGLLFAYAGGFMITYLFGYDESMVNEVFIEGSEEQYV
ncbi:MAG: PTS transporter subunit EIIC [Erysipelothrix sp.]|nr:PTS transporter subunit EIIC [Erysipelothrix sp.]